MLAGPRLTLWVQRPWRRIPGQAAQFTLRTWKLFVYFVASEAVGSCFAAPAQFKAGAHQPAVFFRGKKMAICHCHCHIAPIAIQEP